MHYACPENRDAWSFKVKRPTCTNQRAEVRYDSPESLLGDGLALCSGGACSAWDFVVARISPQVLNLAWEVCKGRLEA